MSEASELAIGGAIDTPLGPGKPVVYDRRLVRTQKAYAALTIAIPTLATAYAILLAVRSGGVSLLNIALFLVFYLATLIGITVGFHRLLAHRAFVSGRFTKVTLAVLGTWAAQGPVLHWVSNHRRHHMSSDLEGDPHSPNLSGERTWGRLRGLFHAHIGSMFADEVTNYARFGLDLLRDPDLVRLNKHYRLVVVSGLAAPALVGGLITFSWQGAWTALLWGGFVRMFVVHHAIWSITSVAHTFGSKVFHSGDESRNSYVLALLTGGEGWHNNHHAFPRAAIFTTSSACVDIGGMVVGAMEKLGLASDVRRIPPDALKAKLLA